MAELDDTDVTEGVGAVPVQRPVERRGQPAQISDRDPTILVGSAATVSTTVSLSAASNRFS